MQNYFYKAITESGDAVSGTITADSLDDAQRNLLDRGLLPSKVFVENSGFSFTNPGKLQFLIKGVKATELILFTKQFCSMFQAGVPIIRLLQVLENQTENPSLKAVIATINRDIREGMTLSDAIKKHPRVFSPLYCSMIHAGEISGSLPEILKRLTYIMEHEAKIKADIKSALQYPLIVLAALGIAFMILLTFVVPKFVSIFAQARIALPLPTKIAMIMHQGLIHYWHIGIALLCLCLIGLSYYFKTEPGRYARDLMILKIPLIGPLFIKAIMSRFSSIFAIMQSSGMAVMSTIEILSTTIGNAAIARQFTEVNRKLQEGQGIAHPLKSTKYFTPMVIDMIAVGEASGNMDEMLTAIAKHYDDEVEYAVKRLSTSIGPILIIGLAAVVGFFALAIFMPMWDLTKMAM
jgi:type II secretory pathway component PulF